MIREVAEKSEIYNFDQLEEMTDGNLGFLKSLAEIFVKSSPADSAELLKATKEGNWQTVSKLAHKLKSTVDGMNIHSIKHDIRTLETDAKYKTNTAALPQLAAKVNLVINEVAKQVRQQFDL